MSVINFVADPKSISDDGSFVAHISESQSKEDLFRQLRSKLDLPDYFGDNWDALADCLRDFHWIKEFKVILVHDEIPRLEPKELSIYFDVLCESVSEWKVGDDHMFEVVFHETARRLFEK